MKINAQYRSKVLAIYDQIPGFLSQHEKRVVFKRLQEGSYAEQYEETFFWLSDAMISNECFLCNDPNVGLYNEEKHRNDIEIDFIISNNSKLKYKMFPIEVKSGKQYKTTSLDNFRAKYKERIGESYIIHPRNLIIKDGIICIPPYMVICL